MANRPTARRRRIRAPWRAIAALLLGSGLLAGCAAERQVMNPGAGLSADTLRAGAVALVGMTVVDEVEQVRPPLVAALESTLVNSRPDLPLRRAAEIRASLGLPDYRRILLAYQSAGTLSLEELAELGSRFGSSARFALFGRVEKNSVNVSGGRPHADPSMSGMTGMSGPIVTPPDVRRDARVRFTLFDLAERGLAWEGVYASSSKQEPPDTTVNPPRRARFEAEGQSARTPEPMPDVPEAPSLAEALGEAFRALAADLPGAPPAPPAPTK